LFQSSNLLFDNRWRFKTIDPTICLAIGLNGLYPTDRSRNSLALNVEPFVMIFANDCSIGKTGQSSVVAGLSGKKGETGSAGVLRRTLVGYTPGYRASAETGLGAWKTESLETNRDHWGADHCFDPASVPGVLFYNQDLANYPSPSYRDIPALAVDAAPDARGATPPPSLSAEDQEKSKRC
jgi:hypothetical protein